MDAAEFRGKVIGYIITEIVLAIFTAGIFTELKWVSFVLSKLGKAGEEILLLINKAREIIGKDLRAAKYADELERLRKAREAKEIAKKFAGAKGLIGKAYEDFLKKVLKGEGSFSVQGREFDGKYNLGKIWYEAKSGRYWIDHVSKPEGIAKFKSDMGHRLSIAISNGAKYELYSNTLVPDNIKSWLTQKGIKYIETLN